MFSSTWNTEQPLIPVPLPTAFSVFTLMLLAFLRFPSLYQIPEVNERENSLFQPRVSKVPLVVAWPCCFHEEAEHYGRGARKEELLTS